MLIKDRVWNVCECCGTRKSLISEAEYGCDECGKAIGEDYLRVGLFFKNNTNKELHLCSWKCILKKLSYTDTDNFIDLPVLAFDEDIDGQRAMDFWDAIRDFGHNQSQDLLIDYG